MENKYRLGLVSVSFRNHTPENILRAMRDAGLSVIEWGSDVHAPYTDKEKLSEIAKLQKEYGIECSSYGTYFDFGKHRIEELPGYIEAAKILGTDILRLWCGNKSGKDMTGEEKEEFFALCKTAAKIAEQSGVILCMERHEHSFTERAEDVVELMNTVNSPNFRMYWQPALAFSAEENVEMAKILAPYTENIHVFNYHDNARHTLFEVVDRWRMYLKEFSTPRTLLMEFLPDNRLETLSVEADALREIVK